MPTITFNLKELQRYLGKVSSKQLTERVPFLGTPIEAMDGNEMTIEVPPNRPDLLSLPGFARAMSTFLGKQKGLKRYVAKKANYVVLRDKSVSKVRPHTVCAVVKGLRFTDEKIKEVIDLQEKIHVTYGRNRKKMALGIYPLEKIRFPIRYLAKKPEAISFVPLDLGKKLTARQILALHPTGKTYGHLLESEIVYPVFVDANEQILSMPPIINSNTVGKISTETKNVFIECSGFDFTYLSKALSMVVTALADMGGQIFEVAIKDTKTKKTPELNPTSMKFNPSYINRMLGITLTHPQLKQLLEKMGLGYDGKQALIPCYRTDMLHPRDLVEDVAIAYGYENIEPTLPSIVSTGREHPFERFKNTLRDILVGAGLIEVKNFSLSNKVVQNQKVLEQKDLVELQESFSEEYAVLRRHLLPSLLETLARNRHREYPQNIFELGVVCKAKQDIVENDRLGVALCNKEADTTRIKQVLDVLMRELGLSYTLTQGKKERYPSFIPGRVGVVEVNNSNIAHFGEVAPTVLEAFELEMPVAILELDIEKLFAQLNPKD